MAKPEQNLNASLGDLQKQVDAALAELNLQHIVPRLWAHDHTVWKQDATEIGNRLGWLHSPEVMPGAIPEITAFADEVRNAGFTHALLLGMGGSSLAPEVFRFTFGIKQGYLDLAVLDSTDPAAVLAYERRLDISKTLFIVSTKSGGTVETFSFFRYFYNRTQEKVGRGKAGSHFVAITDPGSGLEITAQECHFRKTFRNDPNIGGRYSALSYFGLVPAALIGMDLGKLLGRAGNIAKTCLATGAENSGAALGAIMGECAVAGRDKVTLVTSPAIAHLGTWVEQLVAESTGKEGTGILPVDGEELGTPAVYANDRLFVHLVVDGDSTHDQKMELLRKAGHPVVRLHLHDTYDLGGEFFRWQIATVIAGWRLKINPFDQPNVESAKVLARHMVSAYHKEGRLPEVKSTFEANGIAVFTNLSGKDLQTAIQQFLAQGSIGRSYVSVQAYVPPTSQSDSLLNSMRLRIRDSSKLATTVGYGPRFLHSTGQLHKGDAGHGLFIQFTSDAVEDVAIPDQAGEPASAITFGVLKLAQALGDRQALLDAGRKVIRFHFEKEVASGLQQILQALR
ncbi:MAG TPA: glucose-6-phosphate isomerase [bacterium]